MMKRFGLLIAGLWVIAQGVSGQAATKRPNILFLVGEAQGWSSLSVPMDDRVPDSKSDLIRTPNLDRVAKSGMRFPNFYAPSPRCTPSRAAFYTGKSPAQLHMTFVNMGRPGMVDSGLKLIPPHSEISLPLSETTIAELLKPAGYMTAHFGKWHIGRIDPAQHGYDASDGPTNNGGPEDVEHPNPKEAYGMAERAMGFMAKAVKAGKPFYIQVAQYAGRSVLDARQETYNEVMKRANGRDRMRVGFAAVAEDADITYGMLLKKLEALGIKDNTYVIYTADHGAQGRASNLPLSYGKGSIWDGGLRVPLLVSGPGIKPDTFAHQFTEGVDLFPTIAELAGVEWKNIKGIEGGSLVPILKNGGQGEVKRARAEYVVHFPHYDMDTLGPSSAIYLGNYKLIHIYESGQRLLFDVSKDRAEENDLARQMPEKVAELDRRLKEYLTAVKAELPAVNPHADPTKTAASTINERRGQQDGKGRPGGGGARRRGPLSRQQ